MPRILIADDHTIVRRGLIQILQDGLPSAIIEEVEDADALLKKVFSDKWDLVITDLSMPGRSGLDAVMQIKQQIPELPVLVLSIHSADQYSLRALKAGASGYLTKDAAPNELVDAAKQLLMGKKYITPKVAEKLADTLQGADNKLPHEVLSYREFEVLLLIAKGLSITEIAEKLSLSVTTISTYRARIVEKMKLKSTADLIIYAIEHKLI
jgi:two-component system, NarL family, invasion response regulator UvrY